MANTVTPAVNEQDREEYERRLREENDRASARAAAPDVLVKNALLNEEFRDLVAEQLEEQPVGPTGFAASTPIQTTYPDTIRPGIAGMIANEEPVRLISRTVEDAAGIAFGLGVVQGVADKGCKVGTYSEGAFLGVTVRERSIKAEFPNGFMQYDSARIMRSGCIWVAVTAAVVAGNPAKVSATGTWGPGSGTGDVNHCRFETSQPTPGGLAILRLDG
jgi:hypothetical protein